MAKQITFSEAVTRFENLATTGISISDAIQEAVDRIYEMGRYPGATVELTLDEKDFQEDSDLGCYFLYFDEEIYDGAIGFRSDSRGWGIVDHTALYKDGINSGDMEFVDMGTVSGNVTSISFASADFDPAGASNSFSVESLVAGSAGELISLEITSSASSPQTLALVSGSAITVTPGDRARVSIGGTQSPDATEILHLSVYDTGEPPLNFLTITYDNSPNFPRIVLNNGSGITYPSLEFYADAEELDSGVPSGRWAALSGASDTSDISTASGWFATSGTGTPTVSNLSSTLQQVIDAIESNPSASSLISISSNDASGVISEVTKTFLSFPDSFNGQKRKYRCPLGFSPANGPYYCLMKLEAPELTNETIIPVASIGALKCAILAVCQEYVNDDERAMLNWQKFEQFMQRSERQVHGPKKWFCGIDSSLRRRPSQFS